MVLGGESNYISVVMEVVWLRSIGILLVCFECLWVRIMYYGYIFFFFSSRRRHTRLQGDWSSDVCSSDLLPATGRRWCPYTLPSLAGCAKLPRTVPRPARRRAAAP